MKKIFITIFTAAVILAACSDDDNNNNNNTTTDSRVVEVITESDSLPPINPENIIGKWRFSQLIYKDEISPNYNPCDETGMLRFKPGTSLTEYDSHYPCDTIPFYKTYTLNNREFSIIDADNVEYRGTLLKLTQDSLIMKYGVRKDGNDISYYPRYEMWYTKYAE